MGVQRRLRRIGNFFDLSDSDVPREIVTTPIQSVYEVGPHNHIDWIRYNAGQAFTPNGTHTLVDGALDDTEQYCYQIHTFSVKVAVAPTRTIYNLNIVDPNTGLAYLEVLFMDVVANHWFSNRQGVIDGGGAFGGGSPTLASGLIVPPGFSLRFDWGNAGAAASGTIQYILMKYPWGARPLVLPGG